MPPALRDAADGSSIMRRAVLLAGWVGAGRPVTAKGVLRPVDVAGALAAIGRLMRTGWLNRRISV
ncbi:hypothetical protein Dvina_01995 [Dactylosporangium vinaceum]|uniref:Uncharacterized protein n=1 Tax=Dactylosporangium vinaceum TaxID=53362 RepID=A0ABV5MF34_9ACTN|nr:hypothetical protein [Dactylosporangium vinaceum]UAB97008.1 hypothetical protein Dvina_01995 [Dactylosporangium vinaceum]